MNSPEIRSCSCLCTPILRVPRSVVLWIRMQTMKLEGDLIYQITCFLVDFSKSSYSFHNSCYHAYPIDVHRYVPHPVCFFCTLPSYLYCILLLGKFFLCMQFFLLHMKLLLIDVRFLVPCLGIQFEHLWVDALGSLSC
jgi:hypothetical protein